MHPEPSLTGGGGAGRGESGSWGIPSLLAARSVGYVTGPISQATIAIALGAGPRGTLAVLQAICGLAVPVVLLGQDQAIQRGLAAGSLRPRIAMAWGAAVAGIGLLLILGLSATADGWLAQRFLAGDGRYVALLPAFLLAQLLPPVGAAIVMGCHMPQVLAKIVIAGNLVQLAGVIVLDRLGALNLATLAWLSAAIGIFGYLVLLALAPMRREPPEPSGFIPFRSLQRLALQWYPGSISAVVVTVIPMLLIAHEATPSQLGDIALVLLVAGAILGVSDAAGQSAVPMLARDGTAALGRYWQICRYVSGVVLVLTAAAVLLLLLAGPMLRHHGYAPLHWFLVAATPMILVRTISRLLSAGLLGLGIAGPVSIASTVSVVVCFLVLIAPLSLQPIAKVLVALTAAYTASSGILGAGAWNHLRGPGVVAPA